MKLKDIAAQLDLRLEPAEADDEITGVAAIETAVAGQLAFIANPKYAAAARTTNASAIIVGENFPPVDKPLLRTKNPQFAYARAVELFYKAPQPARAVHPTAVVSKSARLGPGASVGAGVVIGDNFFAHANVSVRER